MKAKPMMKKGAKASKCTGKCGGKKSCKGC